MAAPSPTPVEVCEQAFAELGEGLAALEGRVRDVNFASNTDGEGTRAELQSILRRCQENWNLLKVLFEHDKAPHGNADSSRSLHSPEFDPAPKEAAILKLRLAGWVKWPLAWWTQDELLPQPAAGQEAAPALEEDEPVQAEPPREAGEAAEVQEELQEEPPQPVAEEDHEAPSEQMRPEELLSELGQHPEVQEEAVVEEPLEQDMVSEPEEDSLEPPRPEDGIEPAEPLREALEPAEAQEELPSELVEPAAVQEEELQEEPPLPVAVEDREESSEQLRPEEEAVHPQEELPSELAEQAAGQEEEQHVEEPPQEEVADDRASESSELTQPEELPSAPAQHASVQEVASQEEPAVEEPLREEEPEVAEPAQEELPSEPLEPAAVQEQELPSALAQHSAVQEETSQEEPVGTQPLQELPSGLSQDAAVEEEEEPEGTEPAQEATRSPSADAPQQAAVQERAQQPPQTPPQRRLWADESDEVSSDDEGSEPAQQPPVAPQACSHVATPPRQAAPQDPLTREVWFYKDLQGIVQGPFSTIEMRQWHSKGYFTPKVRISYGDGGPFLSMQERKGILDLPEHAQDSGAAASSNQPPQEASGPSREPPAQAPPAPEEAGEDEEEETEESELSQEETALQDSEAAPEERTAEEEPAESESLQEEQPNESSESLQEEAAAEVARLPSGSTDSNSPSPRSRRHNAGRCTPCIFYKKKRGCFKGENCEYCHDDSHLVRLPKKQEHCCTSSASASDPPPPPRAASSRATPEAARRTKARSPEWRPERQPKRQPEWHGNWECHEAAPRTSARSSERQGQRQPEWPGKSGHYEAAPGTKARGIEWQRGWQGDYEDPEGCEHSSSGTSMVAPRSVGGDHKATTFAILKLNGKEMDDQRMVKFCGWFASNSRAPIYNDIDFSNNELTSDGVTLLLGTLRDAGTWVTRLKLHRNRIENGAALAAFIQHQEGALQELHLSHNLLTTAEALHVVLTAVDARDSQGMPCYPHSEGRIPFWLRLESNLVDSEQFQRQLEGELWRRGKRMDETCCFVHKTGTKCVASHCAKRTVPQVHLTFINSQVWQDPPQHGAPQPASFWRP